MRRFTDASHHFCSMQIIYTWDRSLQIVNSFLALVWLVPKDGTCDSCAGYDGRCRKLSVGGTSLTVEPRRHACNHTLIVCILDISRFASILVGGVSIRFVISGIRFVRIESVVEVDLVGLLPPFWYWGSHYGCGMYWPWQVADRRYGLLVTEYMQAKFVKLRRLSRAAVLGNCAGTK